MTDGPARLLSEAVVLRRYAISLTRDLSEAEDLLQDCLERALWKWRLRRDAVPLRPWLFTMMRNLHVSRWRRSHRWANDLTLDDLSVQPAVSGGQEDRVAMNEVLALVQALPDEQRAALVLVAIEGLTYAEAAGRMGIAEGTIMSRVSRARSRLRMADGRDAGGALTGS